MGVVQLDGPVVRKLLDRQTPHVEAADHVLQGAADKEMLLLEPQAPALIGAVIGIQHLGQGFAGDFFLDSAVVVANVEGIEIK